MLINQIKGRLLHGCRPLFLSHAGLRSGDNKIGRMYTLRGHEWHFLIETMPEASQPVAAG
jgi:hypothetical protein